MTAMARTPALPEATRVRVLSAPELPFEIGPMNGREAQESGLYRSLFHVAAGYGGLLQVLGLRTASTTSRIAAMTSSG